MSNPAELAPEADSVPDPLRRAQGAHTVIDMTTVGRVTEGVAAGRSPMPGRPRPSGVQDGHHPGELRRGRCYFDPQATRRLL